MGGEGKERGGKGERIKCAFKEKLKSYSRLLSQSFRSCVCPSPSVSSFSLPSHHIGLVGPLLSTLVSFQQSFTEIAHGHEGGIS